MGQTQQALNLVALAAGQTGGNVHLPSAMELSLLTAHVNAAWKLAPSRTFFVQNLSKILWTCCIMKSVSELSIP